MRSQQQDKNREEMRKQCVIIFKDTYEKCEKYTPLREAIEQSKKLTKIYLENQKYNFYGKEIKSQVYNIIITRDRTLQSVQKYYLPSKIKGKTCILNFASEKHPGGGVWHGARTQEESICRVSTLYPCLITDFLKDNYYSYNIEKKSEKYNRIVYIPNVLVFKSDDNIFAEMLNEKDWYYVDVITCAAHNQKAYKLDYEKLKQVNYNKIKSIIESAVENNVDNLILGAFGCGAFANDPKLVSLTFKKVLIDEQYFKYFKNVHFAIFTVFDEDVNLIEFRKTFDKYAKYIK